MRRIETGQGAMRFCDDANPLRIAGGGGDPASFIDAPKHYATGDLQNLKASGLSANWTRLSRPRIPAPPARTVMTAAASK